MTLTYRPSPDGVKVNHYAKYLPQYSKVILFEIRIVSSPNIGNTHTHTHTHTHTRPTAVVYRDTKWSVIKDNTLA